MSGLVLGDCDACQGAKDGSTGEPCPRCHGTGKDRIVQMVAGVDLALTANGHLYAFTVHMSGGEQEVSMRWHGRVS